MGLYDDGYSGTPGTLPPDVSVSFEFFPPSSPRAEQGLWLALERLEPLNPTMVPMTCGAGGSDGARTFGMVERLLGNTRFVVAPHMTCTGVSKDELMELARRYRAIGVRHLVALRAFTRFFS